MGHRMSWPSNFLAPSPSVRNTTVGRKSEPDIRGRAGFQYRPWGSELTLGWVNLELEEKRNLQVLAPRPSKVL